MLGRAAYFAGEVGNLAHDDLADSSAVPLDIARSTDRRFSTVRWAALVATWMLLWGDVSIGTLVGGALVAGILEGFRNVTYPRITASVAGLTRFLVRYVGMVIVSNLRVAWEVITPNNDQIREAIVAVPLRTDSIAAALLIANAVNYTPGSLTLELTPAPMVLYVHVLHFTSVDDVRRDIAKLESLAVRAVSDPVTTTS